MSVADIARRADLRGNQLYRWRRYLAASATLGFMGLACLARELEASASSLAPAEVQELVSKMTQAFERTVRFAETNLLKQALLPSVLRG